MNEKIIDNMKAWRRLVHEHGGRDALQLLKKAFAARPVSEYPDSLNTDEPRASEVSSQELDRSLPSRVWRHSGSDTEYFDSIDNHSSCYQSAGEREALADCDSLETELGDLVSDAFIYGTTLNTEATSRHLWLLLGNIQALVVATVATSRHLWLLPWQHPDTCGCYRGNIQTLVVATVVTSRHLWLLPWQHPGTCGCYRGNIQTLVVDSSSRSLTTRTCSISAIIG
ncbi:hypothetical protein J6590_079788 [Homalodisca vitripennis]|nr:hypothetical protein J6590_079788 [Homalodisca vitripennis]